MSLMCWCSPLRHSSKSLFAAVYDWSHDFLLGVWNTLRVVLQDVKSSIFWNVSEIMQVFFFYFPSFIHKMNTAEFKSATFPNAGPRHLLDDSVMEPHVPSRGQAESSTLSSGISIGENCKRTCAVNGLPIRTLACLVGRYVQWFYSKIPILLQSRLEKCRCGKVVWIVQHKPQGNRLLKSGSLLL